nr:MAG: major capsid protein [Microvirus sp.]
MNEFSKKSNVKNRVPRSTHDLSFQNNLTLKFGAITPVFCREVLAGDSYRISPTFGLRALPLVFPCQTRMRAYLHFFYVRNRTLYKDWMDFIFGTKKNLVPPYLSSSSPVRYEPSSLADYLGLPCVYYNTDEKLTYAVFEPVTQYRIKSDGTGAGDWFKATFTAMSTVTQVFANLALMRDDVSSIKVGDTFNWPTTIPASVSQVLPAIYLSLQPNSSSVSFAASLGDNTNKTMYLILNKARVVLAVGEFGASATKVDLSKLADPAFAVVLRRQVVQLNDSMFVHEPYNVGQCLLVSCATPSSYAISADSMSKNPYRDGKHNPNALPFRAYEAIYNAYYRNQLVEPFMINGQPEYNKFVPVDTGSADSYDYKLHYRNWEDDVFTSCMPSPQQGNAPMVGVTVDGNNSTTLAFSDADGNVYNAVPVLNEQKDGIASFTISSVAGAQVIPVSSALTSGITINDFRNVNALQRYLELSQMRGYRYKDLMDAHLDVNIKFNELMMPEFIGGCSRDINVSQITATANTMVGDVETQVGDYKAQAGLVGQCNTFTKYCDEHGFIIGLMTIVPVPVYGQSLPKFWTKRSQFDYFSPEFANIGMQAVTKKEIAPLNIPSAELDKTFGYQRPWYEYLSALDQSHGLFGTSLRNFILNRTFGNDVNLTPEFLHVDPSTLNDIFSSTLENDDKFIGEVYFNVQAKSAVPSSVLPRLE